MSSRRPPDVLVTGGAGFIGSELVRQLVLDGARVLVVDNLSNGSHTRLDTLPGDSFELVVADVRDTERMASLMRSVDVVFHLACLGVRQSIHSPVENQEVNATATIRMLEEARSASIGRFVYVSSSEVYGSALRVPIAEEHATQPATIYGASKLAAEAYARAYHVTYGLPVVILRPFNAYGPYAHHEGDSGEVIPRFVLRAMAGQPNIIFGDGRQKRDFTFVSDTARGIRLAGSAANVLGETINVGSGRDVSIRELANEIAAVLGRPEADVVHDAPRPGEVRLARADTRKARQLLGFEATMSLSEGLSRVVEWYRSLAAPPELLLTQEIIRNWERSPVADYV